MYTCILSRNKVSAELGNEDPITFLHLYKKELLCHKFKIGVLFCSFYNIDPNLFLYFYLYSLRNLSVKVNLDIMFKVEVEV